MASKPPAKLKTVTPFLTRARQVEKQNPVIAYWCVYWAVQQILVDKLHEGDAEATKYTTDLLNKLEARKEKLFGEDAVTDEVAAQIYIESFAQKIFSNADSPLQGGRATKQTADTFLAAATFLELCKIFGEPDPEINQKIKYSKFHAARILRAIQAGEDPNRKATPSAPENSNPHPQATSPPPALEPPRSHHQNPTVEDAADEDGREHPRGTEEFTLHHSSPTQPRQQSPTPSSPRFPLVHTQPRPLSASFSQFPTSHSHMAPTDQSYFPTAPIRHSSESYTPDPGQHRRESIHDLPRPYQHEASPMMQPSPTLSVSPSFPSPDLQGSNTSYHPMSGLSALPPQHHNQSLIPKPTTYTPPPPPPSFPVNASEYYQPPRAVATSTASQYTTPPTHHPPKSAPLVQQPVQYTYHQQPHQHPSHPPPPQLPPQPEPIQQFGPIDSDATAKAQKHAKWAISALDYEDYPTAIKQLKEALKLLGAS